MLNISFLEISPIQFYGLLADCFLNVKVGMLTIYSEVKQILYTKLHHQLKPT